MNYKVAAGIATVLLVASVILNVFQWCRRIDAFLTHETQSINRHAIELKVNDLDLVLTTINGNLTKDELQAKLKDRFPNEEIKTDGARILWRNLEFQFDSAGKLVKVN